MSVQARIESLHREHDRLDGLIAQEFQHPGISDLELAHLKREKLKLKDEIAALEGKLAHTG